MSEPPVTGHPGVDDALAALADLDGAPVVEHHARLVRAHAALHEALQGEPAPAPAAGPPVPRPPAPRPPAPRPV